MRKIEKREARIGLCRCNSRERVYGVRMEKINKDWFYNWAFEINPDVAKRENYNATTVKGNLIRDHEYPGCPFCQAQAFIICGNCGKLSCNNGTDKLFKCGWCGNEGRLVDYTGDGFSSGGDR